MDGKFNFHYDESEHSRKINSTTILSENYYDNFIAVIVGWNSLYSDAMESRYLEFEEKYSDRKSKGELKSTTIKNKQIKNGFASLSMDNVNFLSDFFELFDDKTYLYFSISSKIEYIIYQLFKDYKNNIFVDIDSMKYSLVKSIVLYQPKEIIEGIYKNTSELIDLLRKFFQARIEINKSNLVLKQKENDAFSQILILLDDVNKSFKVDWEYRIPFDGFDKYLNEMDIYDYTLILDEEGEESKTLKSAKQVLTGSIEEENSKNNFGIRWADMLAGIISKIMKGLHFQLLEDGVKKKILDVNWFCLNEEQFALYKQLNYIICDLHKAWYKSFVGLYSDDMVTFIVFIGYIAHYKSFEEFKKIKCNLHAEYVNSGVCEELSKRYTMMQSKLPVDIISETNSDFFYDRRGAKVYFNVLKQPRYDFKEGSQVIDVLAVGTTRENTANITVVENETAICYRIPDELYEWALTCVAFANKGDILFPSHVKITKVGNQYYADIL